MKIFLSFAVVLLAFVARFIIEVSGPKSNFEQGKTSPYGWVALVIGAVIVSLIWLL